jgi:sulfite exporter TauE/SafE
MAYLMIFAAGFAGSFHCVGMCGGFACALGRDPHGGGATVLRHLLYNTGRLTTYCFLGALAGALGQVICTSRGTAVPLLSGPLDTGQRALALLAGLLMIAMALQLFGRLPRLHRATSGFASGTLAASLRTLVAAPGAAAPLALGALNGFLPCPLVYAFVAQAASTAGVLPGFLTMAAFGLGTFPAMLMMGSIGRMLAPAWRQRGVWLAGGCIMLLGLITLARGLHGGHA